MLKAIDANNAYASALGNLASAGAGAAAGSATGAAGAAGAGGSFASVLKEAVGSVGGAVDASQKSSVAAMNKQMDLIDVVTEVNNAQMVVETVVAVRDRVIQAYQDIVKMPI
jgi:flagellar hook-basal body complex protein FliE